MINKSISERLQKSIVVYTTLGIFTISVIIALVSIIPLFTHLKEDMDKYPLFAVRLKTVAVEECLSRIKDVALQVTSRTRIRDYLKTYNNSGISLGVLVNFTAPKLVDAMNLSKVLKGISRLDRKGNLVVQVGMPIPEEIWQVPDDESREVLMHGPVALGNKSYIVVGAPILDRQLRRVGTDILLFKFGRLRHIMEDYADLGETGETVLGAVRGDRVQLFFPLRGSKGAVPESISRSSPLGLAFEKAFHKETGILKPSGSPKVIAYGPIRDSEWDIVVTMNKQELYSPIRRQIGVIVGIIVVLILLGTLGMVLLLRPIAGKMIIHTDELQQEIQRKTSVLQTELNERKRAEEALKRERSELQEWINTFDTFVGKFDPNGVGIIFNKAPIIAGGVSQEEVVGKYFPDTKWWSHSEIERERVVECFEKAKAGFASKIETNFRSDDGTPVPIIFNCQPVMNDEGKVEYITAEGKTIVEETRLRTELQEAKEALEVRVRERTAELVEASEKLKKEITERKWVEERIEHLNLVLRAIRNINQLIIRERDRDRLLQGSCENLIETRGYYNAWIAILDESGRLVTSAEAGLGEDFLPIVERLKCCELPDCGQRALSQSGVVTIEEPASTCADCPLAKKYCSRGAISVRLEHGGKVYGLLTVSIHKAIAADEEEKVLFKEVAGDIAFALHSIEVEEEHKRIGEELHKSEERYRSFVQHSAEGVYLFEFDQPFSIDLPEDEQIKALYKYGYIAACNDQMAHMYGYSHGEEIVGKRLIDFHGSDDNPENIEFLRSFIRSGYRIMDSVSEEFDKAGNPKYISNNIIGIIEEGVLVRIWASQQDITERKQAEREISLLLTMTQAISESQDFYTALGITIHKVCEATGWNYGEAWVPSDNGQFLKCSSAWYSSTNNLKNFRHLSEEFTFPPNTGLPGRVWSSKRPEWTPDVSSEPETVFLRAQIALESGLKAGFGVPIIANGQVLAVLVFFMFEPREEDKRLVELVSAVAMQLGSVIHRKRVEQALQKAHDELEARVVERTRELAQANIRLQEMDRLKSEFLATMSHELRTPLNSIIGFTGIILKGITGKITKEQKKQLSMVYGSAKHLLNLINDILDLSRIESGKMETLEESFKVEEVISEVTQTLSPMISQKPLKLIKEIPDEIPEIYSDRKKVFQIILNLANNAVKFTDKGEIKIECNIENENLRVSVSDTGIGIKKENMDYLFEAFRQIDGTAQRRYEGAGLGLHLCKKLVAVLDGKIWAESEYGKGSRFTFILPLRFKKGEQHAKKDIDSGR